MCALEACPWLIATVALATVATSFGAAAPGVAQMNHEALADPTRPDDERAQDADRHPLQVYEFFGVAPGMTVADVFPGSGYNTHLLSRTVGTSGKVFTVLGFYGDPDFFGGRVYEKDNLQKRVADARLSNVTLYDEFPDAPAGSVDVAICVRNYHDVEFFDKGRKRADAVAGLYAMVKPGGIVGIVEVATDRPGWDEETHRLNQQVVIDDFTAGGFELAGESDMLANPNDDHSTAAFDTGRHKADRYVLKFRKPAM